MSVWSRFSVSLFSSGATIKMSEKRENIEKAIDNHAFTGKIILLSKPVQRMHKKLKLYVYNDIIVGFFKLK